MYEDWAPSAHQRRFRQPLWAEDYAKAPAPTGLTRAQLRHAWRWSASLGLVVSLTAFIAWRELVPLPDVALQSLGLDVSGGMDFSGPAGTIDDAVLWRDAPADVAAAAAEARRPAAAPRPLAPAEALAFNATRLQDLNHLILVAGHAVVLAEALDGVDMHDTAWYLENYQRDQDLPRALVGHIRSGVEAAAADPDSLLVFSGGQTRPAAGPRDEGSSYYRVAEHYRWWGYSTSLKPVTSLRKRGATARGQESPLPVPQRTVTEDFAADSFQNLLFSLCRFKEVVGRYPGKVTVVSFTFKRRRFEDLHRSALRFPKAGFAFLGLQPPVWSRFDLVEAERGEKENAARSFEEDPYGCHTPALVAKRQMRNPFRRTTPYPLSCGDIRPLLDWCGPAVFPDSLPWSE